MAQSKSNESLEHISRAAFIDKFKSKYPDSSVNFYDNSLESAINQLSNFTSESGEPVDSTDQKTTVLLYLHNDFDSLSTAFCSQINNKEWAEVPVKKYCLVVWDITDEVISKSLKSVAKKIFGYNIVYEKLMKQKPAIFVICSSATIVECIDNVTSLKHFPFNLKHKLNVLDDLEPRPLEDVDDDNEICSKRFHQLMYEYLGNRDFDSFECDEHEHLKDKIYFAIYGLPDSLEENEERKKVISEVYNQIRSTNNKYSKWDDKVVVSFIYNCTESLNERLYVMNPLPIFGVRKCKGDKDPCRLFIDLDLRVYTSWNKYIRQNQLPKCRMVVPYNGRYTADSAGNVVLESYKSPRCSRAANIIKYLDITITILAVIAAFAMVGAFIFPSWALPAGIVGLACALYSITRSSMQIHDRRIHKQDLNVKNADARGAYLNIVGNSIGIVGGALTRTVTIIATKGMKIGKAVVVTVNAFNYAGITADFAGILNAVHAMQGSRRPDALQILQFSFSILFFNNSVIGLVRTKGQFAQSEISKSMKANLTNRPTHKTTGQTVMHLRNIQSDSVTKILNNSTTNTSISKAVTFSSQNGRIALNNVPVSIMKQTVVKFQGMYLPPTEYITNIIQAKFLTDEENVELYVDILYRFPSRIKNLIIELDKKLLHILKEENLNFNEIVKKIFPHSTYVAKILEVTVLYFEEKYNTEYKKIESEEEMRENFFKMIETHCATNPCVLMDLIQFYLDWLTTAIYENERARINREKRRQEQKKMKVKVFCDRCGGHYYRSSNKENSFLCI